MLRRLSANSEMLPRHYQEEVLDLAKQGNVIAALDTGTGKTFIALLLLKWVSVVQPGSKGIFLAPKVALVEQQGRFIASHSALRVLRLHGGLEIDLADRRGWNRKFQNYDIFVMTPQIFLNLITHSLWAIEKVALIILDECHHTRRSHPYNAIMREYFQVSPQKRPKIFGMTASPVHNVEDAKASLATLEGNLDAKVVAVRVNVDEFAAHAPQVSEVVKIYPSPPEEYDFPSPTLWMCLDVFKPTFCNLNINWDDIERRYATTLFNLGPYCASMYLYLEINHRISQFQDEMEGITDGSAPRLSQDLFAEMVQIQDLLAGFEHLPAVSSVSLEWCSPKIRVLVETLLSHNSQPLQCIIFVEQRQIAFCLAKLLPSIADLGAAFHCAELVGQSDGAEGVSKMSGADAQSTLQAFREGAINMIIATAVAEEGLDLPACDLVIRFDALQHMIGYVQSRGRARSKASSFVVMVSEDDSTTLARYHKFSEKDPELKAIYQSRQRDDLDTEDEMDEETHATDLAHRERYVVASTGAILTYDNAISVLGRLCALIPRDAFTPPPTAKYSGEFRTTVQLPTRLPLSQTDLRYQGPRKLTKKEAKCAVAFMAVKRLHELDVFDQYLLPIPTSRKGHEENDGTPLDVDDIPNVMRVSVKDPWTTDIAQELWIHNIFIDDRRVAGLVTGTKLFPVELDCGQSKVWTCAAELVNFDEPHQQRQDMHIFTRQCIWYRITGSPIDLPLSLYLVPVKDSGQPDFSAIQRLVTSQQGESDWDDISERHYGHLMVANVNTIGKFYLLQNVRFDISPSSVPADGSQEAGFPNLHDYWVNKWTGKTGNKKRKPFVPDTGPLLELSPFPRMKRSGAHPLNDTDTPTDPSHVLLPRGCCRWIDISEDVREALAILPALYHRMTDTYRVRLAHVSLSLPPIPDNLLVEALTLPCAAAGYSNQRLETLGDAVLQLCTTVHLFNRYPNRHEGQLSVMRQNSVCNRFLLARAKEIGLENFLICETKDVRTWRSSVQRALLDDFLATNRCVSREFPRRSLQDCMEATLGASFVTGGIETSLHCGRVLGLDFGGPTPWNIRYNSMHQSLVPSVLSELEETLGYSFRSGKLLLEALTHPSFDNRTTPSYERLEFLGDAILDLVVIDYMYRKFPNSDSDQLAWPRTRAICAPALAYIAVRWLKLHQLMLVNSVKLSMEIQRYVPQLQACSGEEIVHRGWAYDPPKVLSDVFESVIGAVLVDSNYNYEHTASVVELVMEDVLAALTPSLRRDPISELLEWAGKAGCTSSKQIVFQNAFQGQEHKVTAIVHGTVVVGPVFSASALVAKNLAAEQAMSVLANSANEKSLTRLCDCREARDLQKKKNSEQMPVCSLLAEQIPVSDRAVACTGDPSSYCCTPR
ncbi:hypothetical protein C8R47DRAFT_1125761 [Mycena vitilis]|nr:hypothetical protein C8R47DRAFT_1125761 [Mycena vitilis]